jgi:hypothetical protein
MAYIWPTTLPQNVQKDSFSESKGVNVLRTSMDSGPAKQRRVGKRVNTMQVGFFMDSAQITILNNFIENTIKGTARFEFPHPFTAAILEVRIVPQDGGELYTLSPITNDWFSVSMTFEVMP